MLPPSLTNAASTVGEGKWAAEYLPEKTSELPLLTEVEGKAKEAEGDEGLLGETDQAKRWAEEFVSFAENAAAADGGEAAGTAYKEVLRKIPPFAGKS